MAADDILAALPKLSKKQLREVSARAAALIGTGPKEHSRGTIGVLDAVSDCLRDRGSPAPPLGMLKRMPYSKAAGDGALVVEAFVREKIRPPTKTHDVHVYAMLVRMLGRWLEEIKVPVTHRNLCQNLEKIPAIVDRQFPGYRDSDLLHWVLTTPPKV